MVAASAELEVIARELWENPVVLARIAYLHIPHHFGVEPAIGAADEFMVQAGIIFERTRTEGPNAFAQEIRNYLDENKNRFVRT